MAKKLNHITVNKHNSDTVLIENIYTTDGEYWKFDMPASDADVYSTFVDADKMHSISICGGITHGTLEVNASSAAENSAITVTAHPDNGYRVHSVTIKEGDEEERPLEGDGQYFFNMGTEDVVVCARFVDESALIATSVSGCLKLSTGGGEHLTELVTSAGSTIQIHPTDGNIINSVSITSGSGHVQYSISNDDVISFKMPDSDVEVDGTCITSISGLHKLTIENITGGGAIEPSKIYFATDENITMSLYPDRDRVADTALYKQGNDVTNITLDGSAICGGSRDGDFRGPNEDIVVYGSFAYCRPNQNEHSIKVSVRGISGGNSCSSDNISNITAWASKERATKGEIISIGWNLEVCCEFNNISFDNANSATTMIGDRTFIMPDKDIEVYVRFKKSESYAVNTPQPQNSSGANNDCEREGVSVTACKVTTNGCTGITFGQNSVSCGTRVRLKFNGLEELEETEEVFLTNIQVKGRTSGQEIPVEIEIPDDDEESESDAQPITYAFDMPSENVDVFYCFGNDPDGGELDEDEYYIYLDVKPTPHSGKVTAPTKAKAGTLVTINFELVSGQKVKSLRWGAVNGGTTYVCIGVHNCSTELSGNYYVLTMPKGDIIVCVELEGGSSKKVSACDALATYFDNCDCKFVTTGELLSDLGTNVTEGYDTWLYLKRKAGEHAQDQIILTAYYGTDANKTYVPVTDSGPVDNAFVDHLSNIICQTIDKENELPTYESYTFIMPNKAVTVCPMVIPEGDKKIYRDHYYYTDDNDNQFDAIYSVKVNNTTFPPSDDCDNYDVCYEGIAPGSEVEIHLRDGFKFTYHDELTRVWMLGTDGKKTNLVEVTVSSGVCSFTMPITDVYLDFSIIAPVKELACNLGYSYLKMMDNEPEGVTNMTFELNGVQVFHGCAPEDETIRVKVDTMVRCHDDVTYVPSGFLPKSPSLIDLSNGQQIQTTINGPLTPVLGENTYTFTMPMGKSCEFRIDSEDCARTQISVDGTCCVINIYKNDEEDVWETVDHSFPLLTLERSVGGSIELRFEFVNIDECYEWRLNSSGKQELQITDPCGATSTTVSTDGKFQWTFRPWYYKFKVAPKLKIRNDFSVFEDQSGTACYVWVDIENACYRYSEPGNINYVTFNVSYPNCGEIHGYSGNNPYELIVEAKDNNGTTYTCESLGGNRYRFYVDRPSQSIADHRIHLTVKYVCHAKVLEIESTIGPTEYNNLCVFINDNGTLLNQDIRRKVFPNNRQLTVRMYTCNAFVDERGYYIEYDQHTALGTVYLERVTGSPDNYDDDDKINFVRYTSNKTGGEEPKAYIDVVIELNEDSVDGIYTLKAEYLTDSLPQLSVYINKSEALSNGTLGLIGTYQFNVTDEVTGVTTTPMAHVQDIPVDRAHISYHGSNSRDKCELNSAYILIPEGLGVKFSPMLDGATGSIEAFKLYSRGVADCYEEFTDYQTELGRTIVFTMPDDYVRIEEPGQN